MLGIDSVVLSAHAMPLVFTSPVLTFVVSMLFPSVGVVMALRLVEQRKLYFGPYPSFQWGEGLCRSALLTIVSVVVDGRTPHAFYTEPQFYLVFVPVYAVVIYFARTVAKQAEALRRPEAVGKLWNERYHTYVGLPLGTCQALWLIFPAVDYHPLWGIVLAAPFVALWGYLLLVVDAKRPVPQSMAEWMNLASVAILMVGACALALAV